MSTNYFLTRIEKPSYGSGFSGRNYCGSEGKIPYTAPGEFWLTEKLRGKFRKPLKPLSFNWLYRRKTFCKYFPLCSGCQWQHIKPKFQTEFKIKLFEKYLGLKPQRVLVSKETGYRVKTFLYSRGRKPSFKKSWIFDPKLTLLEIENCHLLQENLNRALKLLRPLKFPKNLHGLELFVNPQTGELFLKLLFLRKGEISKPFLKEVSKLPFKGIGIYRGEYLDWKRLKVYGNWETTPKVGKYEYTLSPDCFIQPNRYLWEEFLSLLKPLRRHKRAVELHAGIGFFTLPLSQFVEELESSDISGESFKFRELNTRRFAAGKVKNLLSDAYKHLKRAKDFSLLLVDPPRGGLTEPVVREILKKEPEEIIYISCNLESLRKDIKLLREKYEIVKSALVDQFPNTYHVESVLHLRKI